MKGTTLPVPTWDAPVRRTLPPGRTCAHDGCGTRLSIYNPTPFCCLHGGLDRTGPVADGYQRCRVCCRILPATSDYFHRHGSKRGTGLYKACKDCRNLWKRDHAYVKPDAGTKTCRHCGRTKPLNADFWYPRQDHERCSWSSRCRACAKRAARVRARAVAAKKREEVTA